MMKFMGNQRYHSSPNKPNPAKRKYIESDRRRLKKQGIIQKYLIHYCDDWIILTI